MITGAALLRLAPWITGALAALFLAGWALHIKAELDGIPKLRADLKTAQDQVTAEKTALQASETAREGDQKAAATSLAAEQQACLQRLSEARRSASAIRTLTHAPVTTDASGCPARALLTDGVLSDALGTR